MAWTRAEYTVRLPPPPTTPEGRAAWNVAKGQIVRILRREGRELVRDAKRRAPRRRRGGRLRAGIQLRMSTRGREVKASVLGAVFYAAPSNARGRSAGWWDALRWPEGVDASVLTAFAASADLSAYLNASRAGARRVQRGLSRVGQTSLIDALFGPEGSSRFTYTITI